VAQNRRQVASGKLTVSDNISLPHLPPYRPEINPVENIWRYLRQNFLNNRSFDCYDQIVDARCAAWRAFVCLIEKIW
jgi:transposase